MGLLLNYFNKLKPNTELDRSISDAILGHAKVDTCETFCRDNWTEEGVYLYKFDSWFVPYREQKINSHFVLPRQDAFSSGFSGCAMARFLNFKGTEIHVAHIWLRSEYEEGDRRMDWISFCERNPYNRDFRIFRPKAYKNMFDFNFIICKCGLISSDRRMFDVTIIIDEDKKFRFSKIEENKPSFKGSKSKFLPQCKMDFYKNK